MTTLEGIADVAAEAVRAGGGYLREEFAAANTAGEYGPHDVKAEVDRESERRVLSTVEETFPDHAIDTEESGVRDHAEGYRWVIDPLDGTNDFTAGLPTFSVAVAVLEDDDPVVAAVYLPVVDDLYVARRGAGVHYDGERVESTSDLAAEEATVAFVTGHDVDRDPEKMAIAGHLRNTLEVRTKRVIDSWAPTVHWALASRGLIQGVVTYYPDDEEQYTGELLAEESGARIEEGNDVYVAAANGRVLAALADVTEPVV